jgi:predicted Zn-dependent peptidase
MITTHQLANGLSVIIEEMSHVESASYDLFSPTHSTTSAFAMAKG